MSHEWAEKEARDLEQRVINRYKEDLDHQLRKQLMYAMDYGMGLNRMYRELPISAEDLLNDVIRVVPSNAIDPMRFFIDEFVDEGIAHEERLLLLCPVP